MPLLKFLGVLDSDSSVNGPKKNEVPIIVDEQPCNPYTEIQVLQAHTNIVRFLLVIDDHRFASAGDDNDAIIWDYKFGIQLHRLSGHTRPITCMLLHNPKCGLFNKKALLLTGSSDKIVLIWDIEKGICLRTLKDHCSSIKCLLRLDDNKLICGAGENVVIWGSNLSILCMYERLNEEDISNLICVNEKYLVTSMDKQIDVFQVHSSVYRYASDVKELRLHRKLHPHRDTVKSLVSINDGIFVSGSLDGSIIIWATINWTPLHQLNTHRKYLGEDNLYPYSVQHILRIGQGYILVTIGNGFSIFDVHSGRALVTKPNAHYSKVLHQQLICSGLFIATCSEDGCVRLWGFPFAADNSISGYKRTLIGNKTLLPVLQICDSLSGKAEGRLHASLCQVQLMGECVGHSGSVHKLLNLGSLGFATCGIDKLVILWKDGEIQWKWRNELLQKKIMSSQWNC